MLFKQAAEGNDGASTVRLSHIMTECLVGNTVSNVSCSAQDELETV